MENESVTRSELAKILGLTERTVGWWARLKHEAPLRRVRSATGRMVYRWTDVEEFLQRHRRLWVRYERWQLQQKLKRYEDVFTTAQAEKIIGVVPQTVRNWMTESNGKLPGENGTKNVKITRSEIERLCNIHDVDPTFPPDDQIMFGHNKAAHILGLAPLSLRHLWSGRRLKGGKLAVLRPTTMDGKYALYSKAELLRFVCQYPSVVPFSLLRVESLR